MCASDAYGLLVTYDSLNKPTIRPCKSNSPSLLHQFTRIVVFLSVIRRYYWVKGDTTAGGPRLVIPELRSNELHQMSEIVSAESLPFSLALNPFTLRIPLAIIVCYSHTFVNNLGIKRKFTKYLKESCCMASDQHFSFKPFPQNAFVRKIFPKSSCLFWPPDC